MRPGNEEGSALIILIGIVAALAIMAASIVVLTNNVTHNTYTDRMRVKAFNVTEAGLDAGMYTMSRDWPASQTSVDPFDAAWYTAFRGNFDAAQFPAPASGSFMAVSYFDDPPYTAPYSASSPPTWDMNDNNRLYVVVQGGVGPKAARIQAKVERTFFDMRLPRGIALYAGGNLLSNGAGSNPKIVVEVPPPVGTTTSVHVAGSIEESDVTQTGIAQFVGAQASSLTDIFPQSLVDGLVAMAKQNNRYFTSLNDAEASPVNPIWSPSGGLSGLTVIAPPTPTEVKVQGNTDLNSEMVPGIFMLMGGSTLSWGGTAQFYGVIYSEGAVNTAHGTGDIHGMCIANTNEELKGTPNVRYNDNCIARLLNRWSLNVRLVPNTWRELRPL
ncbi:MAG TPA: hypothetical protein VJ787_02280 [Thermoleophilia bacterium]|nr:hypothetical protein [Thermoleophilia bacterium]